MNEGRDRLYLSPQINGRHERHERHEKGRKSHRQTWRWFLWLILTNLNLLLSLYPDTFVRSLSLSSHNRNHRKKSREQKSDKMISELIPWACCVSWYNRHTLRDFKTCFVVSCSFVSCHLVLFFWNNIRHRQTSRQVWHEYAWETDRQTRFLFVTRDRKKVQEKHTSKSSYETRDEESGEDLFQYKNHGQVIKTTEDGGWN